MSFLDALTADAWPRDTEGRRVLAPYGTRGKAFILPEDRALQLARIQRRYFSGFFLALAAAFILGPWGILAVSALGIAGILVGTALFTRGLQESSERPTMPRAQAVDRAMRAMGRPTMVAFSLAGAAASAAGVWWLLRGERGLAIWFLTFYGSIVCLLYASKLRRLHVIPPAT